MSRTVRLAGTLALLLSAVVIGRAQTGRGASEDEALRHFQALLRLDTSNPPGNEGRVVEYLESVLKDAEIETQRFAREPNRPNLVARLRGNGSKRHLLVMGHTDVVTVDASRWTHPPFSATRDGDYIYGRGSLDDKPSVTAALMTMLRLKREDVALDRDVVFLAEASEEGNGRFGINHMVAAHWPEIEAEYCIAEGGGVVREGGTVRFATVTATEKLKIPENTNITNSPTASIGPCAPRWAARSPAVTVAGCAWFSTRSAWSCFSDR